MWLFPTLGIQSYSQSVGCMYIVPSGQLAVFILNHTKIFVGATVDGRNPTNQLILSVSQYLQGVYIPGG